MIFGISDCDKIVSKNSIWNLIEQRYGRNIGKSLMPETFVYSNKNDMNGKNTADTEDDINETISNLTMKVQEQSNTRKILTDELNHLKNDQNNLKKQISEQMKFFNNITKEEEKLRNKVQFMVHHLAGPSEATEDKPYENMTASMFGDGSNEGLNGMMISR